MNKILKNTIHLLLIIIATAACEEKTDWDLQSSDSFTIIDCIITNENKAQEVRIYSSSSDLNGTPVPLSGAYVSISDGTNNYLFIEADTLPGLYLSAPFIAATGVKYTLVAKFNEKIDSAQAEMVPISPLKDLQFEKKDTLYKYVYTESDLPAMTELFYDWSTVPEYCAIYGACSAAETYYTLDIIDVTEEFAPEKQEILAPLGTTIIRKKYSLSDDHQRFIRSLLIETEWRGGIFDVEQGNVPTNFSNGTKGWFAACQVLSDTTYTLD
jgi:hypothetical protein